MDDNGDSSGLSPTHLHAVQCRRFADLPPEVRLSSAPNNEILGALIRAFLYAFQKHVKLRIYY